MYIYNIQKTDKLILNYNSKLKLFVNTSLGNKNIGFWIIKNIFWEQKDLYNTINTYAILKWTRAIKWIEK